MADAEAAPYWYACVARDSEEFERMRGELILSNDLSTGPPSYSLSGYPGDNSMGYCINRLASLARKYNENAFVRRSESAIMVLPDGVVMNSHEFDRTMKKYWI